MFRIAGIALILSVASLTGASAYATRDGDVRFPGVGPQARSITFGSKTGVPLGYFDLCKAHKSFCRLTRRSDQIDGRVSLTKRKADQVMAVNAQVNRGIRSISDQANHGVVDRWSISPRAGDCEDYALTKKKRLMALGWPSSALLVALATTRRGEPHAVLIVRTGSGDLVLDNLRSEVRAWTPSLYKWESVQSPKHMWTWHRFGRGEITPVFVKKSTGRQLARQ